MADEDNDAGFDEVSALFELFINRMDCYAYQLVNGGYVGNVAEPVTRQLIAQHLAGEMTVGTYQLNKESMVKNLIFDLDPEHLQNIEEVVKGLLQACLDKVPRQALLLEASRWPDPSYHIYLSFLVPIPARVARLTGRRLILYAKQDLKSIEVFPKQDRLTEDRPLGNFVKLPLGLHQVAKKRSCFLDLDTFQPIPSSCLQDVVGITFSDAFISKVMKGASRRGKTRSRSPKGFTALPDKEEERIVRFLYKYWNKGSRNRVELYFLGWAIKKGIARESARRIISAVVDRTGDEERFNRLQLVDYHYSARLKTELKGISGLREIVQESM